MLRTLASTFLPLLSLSLIPACSSSSDDELAGEADEGADGKADSPRGAYTYFALTADVRACSPPTCGGFHIQRLNASTTACHDGSRSASCYTPELDFSKSGLFEPQRDALRAAAGKGASSEGVFAIVRGRFAATNTTTAPELGRFVVTEGWVARGDGVAEGVFAKIFNNGVYCVTTPCPDRTEKALNSSRSAAIAELDFSAGNFEPSSVIRLSADTSKDSGIIVAGDRYTVGGGAKGRTATNAYSNLANEPVTCLPIAIACPIGSALTDTNNDGCPDTCLPVVCPPVEVLCPVGQVLADLDGDGCWLDCVPG
jgi:hypothetical protein